jgi:hypothetical protein
MVGTMNPLGGNPRPFQGGEVVSEKEMVSAIYNCVKKNEERLVDEKAFLISLSVGVPIDDFYEVDSHIIYRGLENSFVANCEKFLSMIDKYDEKTVLEASLYLFNLIRRGVKGELGKKTTRLLSDLGLYYYL